MADSYITVIDIETQQPKKIKIRDNGDGTFSYSEAEGGFVSELTGLSAGALNADLVPPTLVTDFNWFALQILGTFVGTLTFQGSNDNSNWVSVTTVNVGSAGGGLVSIATAPGLFHGMLAFKYFRVRMTAWSSGTATGILELFSNPLTYQSFAIAASQQGTWQVNLGVPTSGGVNNYHKVSAASNNADSVKSSGGQIFGYDIYNTNAAVRYVKLYNKATNPVPGTDNALLIRTIAVPPNGKATYHQPAGIAGFTNGIGIVMVTGSSDTDNTSVGAGDLIVEIDWK